MSKAQRAGVLAALWGLFAIIAAFLPPIPQNPDYHHSAEQRTLLGIPHVGDVLSNLPFAIIGIIGLNRVWRQRRNRHVFYDQRELLPWLFIFGGIDFSIVVDACIAISHSFVQTVCHFLAAHGAEVF